MASLFGFGSVPITIEIRLAEEQARKQIELPKLPGTSTSSGSASGTDTAIAQPAHAAGDQEYAPLYLDGESIAGTVVVRVKDGKKVEHTGVRIELIGGIDMYYDRGNSYDFLALSQELTIPGEMRQAQEFPFSFKNVEKSHETYHGINAKLRYYLRVTVAKRGGDVQKEREIWVHSYRMPPESNLPIRVGIESALHLEFEYNKSKYHLKDCIVGKCSFLLVRVKLKTMELSIIRRETTGSPPSLLNESVTVCKMEMLDGSPQRGDSVPIRLFLGGYDLTPTYRDVCKRISCRYFLNLVLIDESNRRFYKSSEITLFRLPEN